MKLSALCMLLFVGVALCDVYMHNPRGSNDRLNEANTNRNNAQRLFDSQNNAKGGYCYGPAMSYYEGSRLMVEWTAQHGCGNPRMKCNVVLQYMCGSKDANPLELIRDGTTTNTIPDDPNQAGDPQFGMHESYQYYQECKTRDRNFGLWISDRESEGGLNAGRSSAIFTRQSNDGTRHGFECTEERDYFPYWHPSPWRDIAVFTDDNEQCDLYRGESQNVKKKGYCVDASTGTYLRFNQKGTCQSNGGKWKEKDSWGLSAPHCIKAVHSRENHLGNTGTGMTKPSSYNWTLPSSSDLDCMGDGCNCVLRIRYNISTLDFDYDINSQKNGDKSPVSQDPIVTAAGVQLKLALNTNQYGRTFEDRSHVFHIKKRDVSDVARIYNVNVKGKRGNIVQAYPSTEYDFIPTHLHVKVNDYIHFQWTGCDTNPQGNAGEGTDGTDRSNIVQIEAPDKTYPASESWLNSHTRMFSKETAKRMAYLDQTDCKTYEEILAQNGNNEDAADADPENCLKLNKASQYFNGGLVKMSNAGTFYYMSTRNHNFSNRDQKGSVAVENLLPAWAIALLCVGAVIFVGSGGLAGAMFYAKSAPHSKVAQVLNKFS